LNGWPAAGPFTCANMAGKKRATGNANPLGACSRDRRRRLSGQELAVHLHGVLVLERPGASFNVRVRPPIALLNLVQLVGADERAGEQPPVSPCEKLRSRTRSWRVFARLATIAPYSAPLDEIGAALITLMLRRRRSKHSEEDP
jgi:hypothetical protein